jgi:hypothetical protein
MNMRNTVALFVLFAPLSTRAGDRLVGARLEETQKSDGFGQHNLSHVVQVVRLDS